MRSVFALQMNRRRRTVLILLAIVGVLFAAILAGSGIGDRIRTISQNAGDAGSVLPTPVPNILATLSPAQSGWKKVQIVVIATDPAFPDPRLTPTPEPPTPPPTAEPTPSPSPVMSALPVRPVNTNKPPWYVEPTAPASSIPLDELRP